MSVAFSTLHKRSAIRLENLQNKDVCRLYWHIIFSKIIEDLTEMFTSDLKCLKAWFLGDKLSLNVVKTQAVVIVSRSNL